MAEKPIAWVGTSLEDLIAFPVDAKKEAGYQLHRIQNGYFPEHFKPFKQVGIGVNEVRIMEANGIYRLMYVAKFQEAVYVLHAFEKKSQKTTKHDVDIAIRRYKSIVSSRSLMCKLRGK